MDNAKRQEIRQWLIKSQRDIGSARRLMEGQEPYLDTAVYHCQQAAEKALKAFLMARDMAFEKQSAALRVSYSNWKEARRNKPLPQPKPLYSSSGDCCRTPLNPERAGR
jgi:HEPN domain-containing protein